MVGYGGKAIPYHSSVRIKLTRDGQVIGSKGKDDIIGVGVRAKCIKNKIAIPFQSAEFSILFNIGIDENEKIFEKLAAAENLKYEINGEECDISFKAGAWSYLIANNKDGDEVLSEKFRKKEFKRIFSKHKEMVDDLLDFVCIRKLGQSVEMDVDTDSLLEVESLANQILEG